MRLKSEDALNKQIKKAEGVLGASLLPENQSLNDLKDCAVPELRERFGRRYNAYFQALSGISEDSLSEVIKGANRLEVFTRQIEDGTASTHLYDHQINVFKDLSVFIESMEERGWIKLPTGSGKTAIFTALSEIMALDTLVVVPRKKLVTQTSKEFKNFASEEVSLYYGEEKDLSKRVVVTTYQSLPKLIEQAKAAGRSFPLVICDEAHRALTARKQSLLEEIPGKGIILGVTATPDFSEIKSVRHLFGTLIHQMHLSDAIKSGIVSGVRVMFVRTSYDLGEVAQRGGDFNIADLERVLDNPVRNEAAVRIMTSPSLAGESTVINCISINHARNVTGLAKAHGVHAAYIHGEMSAKEQERILSDFEKGKITHLCCVDLLTEGWDCPRARIMINLRPTGSPVVAEQRGGRVLRNYPGKDFAMIFEFVDNDQSDRDRITMVDILGGAVCLPEGVEEKFKRQVSLISDTTAIDFTGLSGIELIVETEEVLKFNSEMHETAAKSPDAFIMTREMFQYILDTGGVDETLILSKSTSRLMGELLYTDLFSGRLQTLAKKYFQHILHIDLPRVDVGAVERLIEDFFPGVLEKRNIKPEELVMSPEETKQFLHVAGFKPSIDNLLMLSRDFEAMEFTTPDRSLTGRDLIAACQGVNTASHLLNLLYKDELRAIKVGFPLLKDTAGSHRQILEKILTNPEEYIEYPITTLGRWSDPDNPITLKEILAAHSGMSAQEVSDDIYQPLKLFFGKFPILKSWNDYDQTRLRYVHHTMDIKEFEKQAHLIIFSDPERPYRALSTERSELREHLITIGEEKFRFGSLLAYLGLHSFDDVFNLHETYLRKEIGAQERKEKSLPYLKHLLWQHEIVENPHLADDAGLRAVLGAKSSGSQFRTTINDERRLAILLLEKFPELSSTSKVVARVIKREDFHKRLKDPALTKIADFARLADLRNLQAILAEELGVPGDPIITTAPLYDARLYVEDRIKDYLKTLKTDPVPAILNRIKEEGGIDEDDRKAFYNLEIELSDGVKIRIGQILNHSAMATNEVNREIETRNLYKRDASSDWLSDASECYKIMKAAIELLPPEKRSMSPVAMMYLKLDTAALPPGCAFTKVSELVIAWDDAMRQFQHLPSRAHLLTSTNSELTESVVREFLSFIKNRNT